MLHPASTELITFYNVENLFSPDAQAIHRLNPTKSGLRNWDQRRYNLKLQKIASVFELIRQKYDVLPMIIGLSEIQGEKPLEELIKLPPFNSNYGIAHFDSMDERGVDVALLYDKTKIELLFSEPLTYFFEIKDDNPANYDTTRDILHCKLKFKEVIFHVFVLHLPSKRADGINLAKRKYMLQDLNKKVVEIANSGESIIICGDFNDNPDEQYIQDFLHDAQGEKILQNPFLPLFQNKKFSTFHRQDGLLFDQTILSQTFFNPDFPLSFKDAQIFNPPQIADRNRKFAGKPFRTYAGTRYLGGYSDHFPITTEFYSLD